MEKKEAKTAESQSGHADDQTPDLEHGSENSDQKNIDPMYQMLKPLHNLPRGKNTWNPEFIKKPWFWPLSAVVLIILFYVYPYIWDYFFE